MEVAIVILVIAVLFIVRTIKIVPQQHAWVVERLGKYDRTLTPGLSFVAPFIERVAYQHSLKEVPLDVPSQVCITRDNTQLQVDGIIYFQVTDPMRASYGSSNYMVAITQLAQTLLRSVIGKMELDKTFEERDAINASVVSALDEAASNWGVKVLRYELKDLTPPNESLRAMQAQIPAEREQRALRRPTPGRDQQSPGRGLSHYGRGRSDCRSHTQNCCRHSATRRRASRAAESGRKSRGCLRPVGAKEQHHDRAGKYERSLGPDRHIHGLAQIQTWRVGFRGQSRHARRINSALPERWMSGLSRTPGKRVGVNSPPRVRIPLSPPIFSRPNTLSLVAACECKLR